MVETKKPSTTTSSTSFPTSVTDFLLCQIGIRFHTPHWETLSPHHQTACSLHSSTRAVIHTKLITTSGRLNLLFRLPTSSFHVCHCSMPLRAPCHLLSKVLPVPLSMNSLFHNSSLSPARTEHKNSLNAPTAATPSPEP